MTADDAVTTLRALPLLRLHLGLWRLLLSVAGLAFLAAAPFAWAFGIDLFSYWTVDLTHPYATINDSLWGIGAFRYAPPVALVMAPLHLLPWQVLQVLWLGSQIAALWYIGRSWFLALILFPPVWLDIVHGNIHIFLATVIVASFRYPAVWAFSPVAVTIAMPSIWAIAWARWSQCHLSGRPRTWSRPLRHDDRQHVAGHKEAALSERGLGPTPLSCRDGRADVARSVFSRLVPGHRLGGAQLPA